MSFEAFTEYVNAELPKRPSNAEAVGGNLPANKLLKTTGVGLATTLIDATSGGYWDAESGGIYYDAGRAVIRHSTTENLMVLNNTGGGTESPRLAIQKSGGNEVSLGIDSTHNDDLLMRHQGVDVLRIQNFFGVLGNILLGQNHSGVVPAAFGAGMPNISIGNGFCSLSTGALSPAYNFNMGYFNMMKVEDAQWNISVGSSTLNELISGYANLAIGGGVMQWIIDTKYNCGIGNTTLNRLQKGAPEGYNFWDYSENTVVGDSALHPLIKGKKNVGIGTEVGGDYNEADKEFDACVLMGFQAGFYNTDSNRLYISNSNTTSPLIYGEFDNNYLKINGSLAVTSLPTSLGGLSAGDMFTQTATELGGSGVTKVVCIV